MSTDTVIRPRQVDDDAAKDDSQLRQKQMISGHFDKLATANEDGRKVAYTFVPGNLTELMLALDMLPVLPEINALQSGMRSSAATTSPRPRSSGTPRTSAPT